MTRTDRVKRVDPSRADAFAEVGRRLVAAARAIREQGDARHAPALAVLSVHAAIAYVDAVCVRRGGRKSTSPDHESALAVLRSIVGTRLPAPISRAFDRVVAEKDRVEYQGYVVPMREAQAALDAVERIAAWAEGELAGL